MKKGKNIQSNSSQKESVLGVAAGLCIDPAIGALKKNKKADEQENDDERQ